MTIHQPAKPIPSTIIIPITLHSNPNFIHYVNSDRSELLLCNERRSLEHFLQWQLLLVIFVALLARCRSLVQKLPFNMQPPVRRNFLDPRGTHPRCHIQGRVHFSLILLNVTWQIFRYYFLSNVFAILLFCKIFSIFKKFCFFKVYFLMLSLVC